ncbi:NAD-dependent epimerase/dehydratase family protein [Gordonia sp. LSe1-13]|uniref:NAD-dependent epimerase/dehydratase family protein n=1 Tax=Gordonia sesuvii TaxID=3116777 RepID=A0ABU7MI29_9ACTN|nr:NAD-dependent epimerase/dehydratase family protein [Gordonia sp. LSe1-13]
MKIAVLGGDGFCGWPSSLHLSASGHDVTIVDSLVRRRADDELGVQSLTPIEPLDVRVAVWKDVSGRIIDNVDLDIAHDYDGLVSMLDDVRPDVVVHFAEQRSAPYSMKSPAHKRYTADNNINATHNVLAAIVQSGRDVHLVHLGTMGVYGYESVPLDLPEGYLTVSYPDNNGVMRDREILYPTRPGSVYHLTKSMDQLMFQFYAQNDGVRITDLHQGIVWGTQTAETEQDVRLINRFDYDGDYGTVLNRFLVQAAIGYPLTVHGSGGQTRAFININDSIECIRLAVESGDEVGNRVRVMNQMTETHKVADLADLVADKVGAQIDHQVNPRAEADENALSVRNDRLLGLGLDPVRLDSDLLTAEIELGKHYAHRIDMSRIPCRSYWNRDRQSAAEE